MYKLYQANLSPFAARIRIQLRAKGISDFELELPPGGVSSDEFKKINPTGKIPFLAMGESGIAESAVINEYIEDKWPQSPLLPADPEARAQVRLLVQCVDMYVTTPMFKTLPLLEQGEQGKDALGALLADVVTGLNYVNVFRNNSGLAGKHYAIGNQLTLADGAIAGAIFYVIHFVEALLGVQDAVPTELLALYEALQNDRFVSEAIVEMQTAFAEKMKGL
jgi:glutathione S-transferase